MLNPEPEIMEPRRQKVIEVSTKLFPELFSRQFRIGIPEYQRPYRWSTEKVEELVLDLEEFFISKPKPNLEYYMGGVLFLGISKKEGSK